MRRVMAAAAVVVVAGAMLATPIPPAAPEGRLALGVNLEGRPGDPQRLDAYRAVAGRDPAIVMWYQQWSEPFAYGPELEEVRARGATPMITWEPSLAGQGIPLQQIASGRYDDLILRAAATARAYRRLLYVRFAHEMNLGGSLWGPRVNGNDAAAFVGAWRRVVRLFRRAGAGNVEWVWSPNVDLDGTAPFSSLYPGDDFVDLVGLDGYNWGSLAASGFRPLGDVFGRSYDTLTRLSTRPVVIAETASAELGGDKAQWIRDGLLRQVPDRLPRVRAVIWFDRNKETDWRISSSPASAAAFRSVAASPRYSGAATPTRPAWANPERPVVLTTRYSGLRGGRVRIALRCQSASACVVRVRLLSERRPRRNLGSGDAVIAPGRRGVAVIAVDPATQRQVELRRQVAIVASVQLRGEAAFRRSLVAQAAP